MKRKPVYLSCNKQKTNIMLTQLFTHNHELSYLIKQLQEVDDATKNATLQPAVRAYFEKKRTLIHHDITEVTERAYVGQDSKGRGAYLVPCCLFDSGLALYIEGLPSGKEVQKEEIQPGNTYRMGIDYGQDWWETVTFTTTYEEVLKRNK